jgi:hypothetical protein
MRIKTDQPILLTEADCFMRALEKRHINLTGTSTNICHYLLELEGRFDAAKFERELGLNNEVLWLASLDTYKSFPLALPEWRNTKAIKKIPVYVHTSEELIPANVINREMHMDESHICCDVVYRSDNNSALIFSWHHLLMDGYGVVLLLKQLAKNVTAPLQHVIDHEHKEDLKIRELANATRAKFFVDRISKKPLSSIAPDIKINKRKQHVKIIRFTEEETKRFDKKGPKLGAQFGRSPVYLASAARGVRSLLKNQGAPIHDLWIPVPKDQRKKGSQGPLLGNHLSFLFYRLKANDLDSLEKTVRSINHQTVDQIKSKMSRDYDMLMKYLRRTPTPLYYYWIKGPQGGSLASFLFTVAADHPEDFEKFGEHRIIDAWSFPSGIYPPGLNFAFMRFKDKLHIMIMYFEGVISEDDVHILEQQFRRDFS